MRYDRRIELVTVLHGEYDPQTGNYTDSETTETAYASVMDTGTQMQQLIYDRLRSGSLTIQLQNRLRKKPDYVRIDGRLYTVDFYRRLRVKETLVVSEVHR